jgi:hypothetical protein
MDMSNKRVLKKELQGDREEEQEQEEIIDDEDD